MFFKKRESREGNFAFNLVLSGSLGILIFSGCSSLVNTTKKDEITVVQAPYGELNHLPVGNIKPRGWLLNVAEDLTEN
ncbi:hypothetical protein AAEX28_09645 [Lentisphaerota bacterium WC36G]|nr:hypothetical protein LJT99_12480 [Lentisphaerae bacterium WC36]